MIGNYSDNKHNHCKTVAEVMYENAKAFGIYNKLAFAVGLVHDVGYIDSWRGHEDTGAYILKAMGVSGDCLDAVRYHGKSGYWFIGNGMRKHISPMLLLLQFADMIVDGKGNIVGFDARLSEIKERYGDESPEYDGSVLVVDFLKEVLQFNGSDAEISLQPVDEDTLLKRIYDVKAK